MEPLVTEWLGTLLIVTAAVASSIRFPGLGRNFTKLHVPVTGIDKKINTTLNEASQGGRYLNAGRLMR